MEEWSSRLGFILASIGSAVGIGNIWRFSTVVGQNGGGAYLIPYLCAVLLVALPLMILEMTAGQRIRGSVVTAFQSGGGPLRQAGWIVGIIVTLILSYYLVITGWTLGYLVSSVSGTSRVFAEFTGSYEPVSFFVASAVLCGAIIAFGVRKGIERITSLLVPGIFLILIGMVAVSVRQPGFADGMAYFLSPDFSVLADPVIWSAAIGQAFFSLSVGYGTLLTYGAYLGSGERIPRSAAIVTAADLTVALLAGTVIFPIVFTFGLEPSAGPELAFTTLPLAFGLMPFGGGVAVAFFLLLFFAAVSSAISFLEVPVMTVAERFGLSRRRSTAMVTGGLILLGLPAALSYSAAGLTLWGVPVLDLQDEVFGTIGLSVAGLLIAIAFSWYFDEERLWGDRRTRHLLIRPLPVLCRYVIPAALVFATGFRIAYLLVPG
ncbi:MAG: sodium-dependent transporter [Methanomicrobiaceae archaeon]|uniref:Sodium-dependent transporter n=1 Tax=hydrocarbon metagenome TaxID=938273 RepID=A0A0W8FJU8_9ZZZZ|nr:sodium-dependent transporter [Methanomicrobiaceae archaeon]MDD5418418.1 sodium-dependent transporter [Methanomicrobiaceae archaeon]